MGQFSKRFERAGVDGRALLEIARLSEVQTELAYKVMADQAMRDLL